MEEETVEKKGKILMNVRIDEELRDEFRIKTIRDKTTMSQEITKFIEAYLEK